MHISTAHLWSSGFTKPAVKALVIWAADVELLQQSTSFHSPNCWGGLEELRKTQMKEKGRERTEEAGITALLCSEHKSLESADVLLQDNRYA